jgi:hypothetical protein
MNDINGICLACHARIELDMPDGWQGRDGEPFKPWDIDAPEVMRDFVHELACPNCGQTQLRVTLPGDHFER